MGWAPTIKSLSYSRNGCENNTIFTDYTIFRPVKNGPDAAMRAMLEGKCDGIYMYADMIETKKVSGRFVNSFRRFEGARLSMMP